MNLTKEYLDKALKNLATKSDLKNFATKDDLDKRLEKQTQLLMMHTNDQVEGLARMVQRGFEDLQERLDVHDRVKKLETEMQKIKEALNV